MMKRIMIFCLSVILMFMLCSCRGQAEKTNTSSNEPVSTDAPDNTAVSATPAPEVTSAEVTVTTPPAPTSECSAAQTIFPIESGDKRYPIIDNTTGKTLIERVSSNDDSDASFLLVTKSGKIVVMDPRDMPDQNVFKITPDIITITHSHGDHYDAAYVIAYKDTANILRGNKVSDLTLDDIRVYSIPASHDRDTIIPKLPTDMIFVYETDGLRIANLGDIGQTKLTEDQLGQIGMIDILITQLNNPDSNLDFLTDTKAKDIIAQLNPKIIIPAHGGDLYAKDLAEFLGADYEILDTIFATDAAELKDSKQKVVLIKQLERY